MEMIVCVCKLTHLQLSGFNGTIIFADILKLKSINGISFDDLQKAYEKQEEMVEDVDSAAGESEEVAMEGA